MATYKKTISGDSDNRYVLNVEITQKSQSVANNTSTIDYKVWVTYSGGLSYGRYWSGGSSAYINNGGTRWDTKDPFSYDFRNYSSLTLMSGTKTVNHNADGTGSLSITAYVHLYNQSYNMKATLTQNITLTTIPRASSFTAFSFDGVLSTSTARTISLTLSRASSSFTHDITLLDGSTTIQSWTGQGVPTSLTISAANVNTMINRMSTVTSKSFTLRVQTKSGSTNIGSALTRTASVSLNTSIVPTISTPSVSRANTHATGFYVQGFSKVKATVTRSAGYGATISSTSIKIGLAAWVAGTSVTSGVLTTSGTVKITATVKDSRGRSASSSTTIQVQAYSNPTISSFSVTRLNGDSSKASIVGNGSYTSLSGNSITTTVLRGSTSVHSGSTTSVSKTDTGLSSSSSYTYTMKIRDSFGREAVRMYTLPTEKVALSIGKDQGVGVGKVWEQGALDVGGDAYFSGSMMVNGSPVITEDKYGLKNVTSQFSASAGVNSFIAYKQGNLLHITFEYRPTNTGYTTDVITTSNQAFYARDTTPGTSSHAAGSADVGGSYKIHANASGAIHLASSAVPTNPVRYTLIYVTRG